MIKNSEIDFNLQELVAHKIEYGQQLLETTKKYSHLEGIQKLERKINQELSFLKKVILYPYNFSNHTNQIYFLDSKER